MTGSFNSFLNGQISKHVFADSGPDLLGSRATSTAQANRLHVLLVCVLWVTNCHPVGNCSERYMFFLFFFFTVEAMAEQSRVSFTHAFTHQVQSRPHLRGGHQYTGRRDLYLELRDNRDKDVFDQ